MLVNQTVMLMHSSVPKHDKFVAREGGGGVMDWTGLTFVCVLGLY